MQLSTLQEVYTRPGPFVTVHVDVSRNTEDAASQLDARWTQTRHQLEHEKVDAGLVEQIGERMREPVDIPGEVRRTIVAAGDEIVFDEVTTAHAPWPEVVSVGELPELSGWVQQVDGQVPFLLVVADREGADIDFYRAVSSQGSEHRQVDGETLHIHKYHGGGWSHRRFQERSENTADANAREVAEQVRGAVQRHRPRAVILAGDERARSAIAGDLDGVQSEVHHVTSGGRGAGSSEEALWNEVRQVVARLEAEDQQQLTDRLERTWSQGKGSVLGVDDVVDALVKRQVETLVVDLQKAHELTVDATRFPGLPIPEQASGRKDLPADQVLVAAAAATDAEVTVVPEAQGKGGGVAALLRWDG